LANKFLFLVKSTTDENRQEVTPNDRAIVSGLLDGQDWAAAAVALYTRIHPVVDKCLRRILRSTGPDYEDLFQAVFERIIRVLSERPLEGRCDLPAWSAAVATHVALDSLRRNGRERRLFQPEDTSPPPRSNDHNVEGRLEARFEVKRLQQILAKMKPDFAETLLLHDVLGHDLIEIAELMGVSVAAAQSRLVRSRKELLRRADKLQKGLG
jgi:RNA polymerase sigma-70 factor, ECF subfamily